MTITIPDFDAYLHYGDRRVPWVKLPRKLFQDWRFRSLPIEGRLVFLGVLVLAEPLADGTGFLRAEQAQLGIELEVDEILPALQSAAAVGLLRLAEDPA